MIVLDYILLLLAMHIEIMYIGLINNIRGVELIISSTPLILLLIVLFSYMSI